jgi:hypothetical protein
VSRTPLTPWQRVIALLFQEHRIGFRSDTHETAVQSTDIQSPPLPRRSPWSILFRFVIAATLLFLGVSWLAENDISSRIGDPRLERGIGTTQAVIRVAGADLGESPGLTPDPPVGPLPLCEPVSDYDERALREGIGLMRGTERGQGLYSLIVNEGVCIRVADLPYNSAYATARWSPLAGWSESEIVIDFDEVSLLYPDVLAAILVHEAVHIERAVNRTACFYADTCTTLDNGVRLEEEIVAHAAEAEWWLEAYGNSGKNFAFRSDHAQNRLANAYLRGNSEFREYVLQGRSNPREGEGIR